MRFSSGNTLPLVSVPFGMHASPYSYLYYEKNIKFFLEMESQIKYVDQINQEVIDEFVGKLMDRGNRVTAINARFRALFVFSALLF